MARNPVQFQKGLSLIEFNRRYGTDEQCHAALVVMRWPDGFECPHCHGRKHSYSPARRIFQSSACRVQTSVRAGTMFHKSRTPLVKWFLAIYPLTGAKNDIAALELARQIGVKWDIAWLIKQKLMEVMRQRNAAYKLEGEVQIDDAYLGGEKAGKVGRGAANKVPFVIAVETRDGKPIHTQLRCVPGFTKEAIKDYASANIVPGTRVLSDGLACFGGVVEVGMRHTAIVTGGAPPQGRSVQVDEHGPRQHQGCDHRHMPLVRSAAHRALSRRIRVALQSPLRFSTKTSSASLALLPNPPKPYRSIATIRNGAETPG
jgi:hypothetical protein